MNSIQQKYKKENTLAYDTTLRERLKQLHDLLGSEVTDIAVQAMDYGLKFQPEAKKMLSVMSGLASDLSVAILSAKADKPKLTEQEQEDLESLKQTTNILGNLQFKLNKIIKQIEQFKALADELNKAGMEFAEDIVTAQENFRMLRSKFNAIGFLSENPKISMLLDK